MVIGVLADQLGVPVWFMGGILGLAMFLIALALMGRFKFKSPASSMLTLALSVIYIFLFAWPFWIPLILGSVTFFVFMGGKLGGKSETTG